MALLEEREEQALSRASKRRGRSRKIAAGGAPAAPAATAD
jgi:hypothetical protein